MKNKVLAIFGIGTYVLSVLSSATDLAGNPVMPTALIVISGIATVVFFIMATIRLWKDAMGLSITFMSSAAILFISSVAQGAGSPPYGSSIIILLNAVKIVNFIALILVIIKLFKMDRVGIINQRERAEKFYKENPDLAMRIATGEEKAPKGILAAAVYAKVCDEAEKSENMDACMRVANSHRNTKISAEAQRLKLRDPDAAIEKMKEVVNARREAFEKTLPKGKTYEMALDEEVEKIKKEIERSK
jgi:hypothetical protein